MRYFKLFYKRLLNNDVLLTCVLYAVVTLLLFLFGCEQKQSFGDNFLHPDKISKEELRSALDNYEEFFIATVKNVSDELDELLPNRENYKSTLHLRDQTISACRTMLEQDDAQKAFIDSWVLAARLVEYIESGQGSDLFGEYQSLAVNAAKQIQNHIETIGKDFLDAEVFVVTRSKVSEFVRNNPIGKNYAESIVFATDPEDGQPSQFENIINLPMAPFRIMEGVTQGVTGTKRLSDTAEHFSDIIEGMPESVRWQLQLLLYDVEKMETVKSALASMNEFSESTSRFADTADKLPGKLRKQASVLLNEIDTKQSNIQTTVDQMRTLVSDIDGLTMNINLRGAQLIVLIFVLGLVYRVIVIRLNYKYRKRRQ